MILIQELDILGIDLRQSLYDSAMDQTFYKEDPRKGGVDHGYRDGVRNASVCYDWEGFDEFKDAFSNRLTYYAHILKPGSVLQDMQLTHMTDGGFFATHTDGGYTDKPSGPSFIYYLGDRSSYNGGILSINGMSIPPIDDSLIVFDASVIPHEVSKVFGDHNSNRFTINGYYA